MAGTKGISLDAEWRASGDDILAALRLGVSEAEPAAAGAAIPIHKADASGDVLVKPGQPTLALRMDDGHEQYDVSVVATLLR